MTELTENQLNQYAHQMLEDYDSKTPGTIFKDKVRIGVEDAWRIQSAVTYLRQRRGRFGLQIDCTSNSRDKLFYLY